MELRLLIVSDSHGRVLEMFDAVERECPDAVLHLGDCYEDAHDLQRSYPQLPVYCVRGNNDWGIDAPEHLVVTLEQVKIYLAHGHREGCTFHSTGRLWAHAREAGCQMACFGHTHIVHQDEVEGMILLNPGSISLPRQGTASYAKVEVCAGKITEICICDCEGQPWRAEKRRKRLGWF